MPNTFDEATQAMIDMDVSEGHIGVDAPVWGMYETRTRAVLDVLKRRFAGTPCEAAIEAVLKGKA